MNRRTILLSPVILIAVILISGQIGRNVSAGESPLSSPVSSPITSPTATGTPTPTNSVPSVTPTPAPVTSPTVSVYKLTGRVTKSIFSRWFKPFRKIINLANIKIVVRNRKTNEVFETTTDINGNFSIELEKGKYYVKPQDSNYHFLPFFRFINLNRDRKNIDFKAF